MLVVESSRCVRFLCKNNESDKTFTNPKYIYPEHICGKLKTDSGTRFCGSTIPDPVVTTSRNMTVFFHSDGTSHYRGFQAEVSLTPGKLHFHFETFDKKMSLESSCGGWDFPGPPKVIISHTLVFQIFHR